MRILSAVVLLSIFFSGCYHSQDADLVVHNAIIHSMDENNTTYQAMAIRDGRIVELGPERQILNRYATTKHYDAGGQVVFPGFIDGHCHFFGYGLNKQKLDLRGVPTSVTASFGVATHTGAETAMELFERAFQAEQRAKQLGRDRVEFAPSP